VVGAVTDQPILLLAAMTVYGSGAAANLQARYAGADLAPPDGRGRAGEHDPGGHHGRSGGRTEPRRLDRSARG
jgi:hypothetical protein